MPTLAHGPEQRVDRVTSPGDRRWGGRPLGHGPIRERHTLRPGVARWRAVGQGVLTRRRPTRRCRAGGPDKANDHGRTVSVDLGVVGLTGARCVAERDDGIATEPDAGLRRNHRDEQLEHILPRHGHRLRIALGLPHDDARRTANLEHERARRILNQLEKRIDHVSHLVALAAAVTAPARRHGRR